MIITDFNEMTINELETINQFFGFEFEINDGKIVKKIPRNE